MKLLIISHTPHYLKQGRPTGWTATVREIDHLAGLFDEITHVAPLHLEGALESADFYKSKNVRFCFVKPAGGKSIIDKIGILFQIPEYLSVICRELRKCDAVHVRCPSNISLIALLVLIFKKFPKKRWIKYAGNWSPQGSEPWSYTLQRWILQKNWVRAQVTVNGRWPNQPEHIHSFLNPCISAKELEEARQTAKNKKLESPIRILFVGRTETEKGLGFFLNVLANLRDQKIDFSADIVGDGPERKKFEAKAQMLGLKQTLFWGWLSREKLNNLYAKAHFILLPSSASEGWPKVLSEAMAFGVIPIASSVSSIPENLNALRIGKALNLESPAVWGEKISDYLRSPEMFKMESFLAAQAASRFTYESYLGRVKALVVE